MKTPKLTGKNIILRPLSLRDAVHFYQWLNDREVTQFLEMYDKTPPTLKQERDYIIKKKRSNDAIQFSINTTEGVHIGTIALDKIDALHKRALFGIFIGNKRYWGQGLGTQATKMILEYGFGKLRLNRIYLAVHAYNIRGLKAYKKAGFIVEGRFRDHIYRKGAYHDEIRMGILKNDWLKNNKKLYGRKRK